MKEIRLENFRCYTDQTIRFKSGINLLVGDNASGKTTVLKACKYILSAFFAGFSDENTRWISPQEEDYSSMMLAEGVLAKDTPLAIYFDFESHTCKIQKNSRKTSKGVRSGIQPYIEYAHNLQETELEAYPVFANYSTEGLNEEKVPNSKRFANYVHKRSFGYFECLSGKDFFSYWTKRLLVLQEGQKNLEEIEIVRKAIQSALGETGCNIIRDIQIRPIQNKVYYIFTDNREVETNLLSDGYRRLVSIVVDLAFRCALLNRIIYNAEACEKAVGTVLLDEVDLSLHPTLQTSVLKGLRNAFPNLQFIVTTHAPMVMTGIESNDENVVYKLSYSSKDGYHIEEAETYGMDMSTITNVVLGQTPRDAGVDKELEILFSYIDEEKYSEALSKLSGMKEKFSDNLPELSKAEAMLNFMMDEYENEEDN